MTAMETQAATGSAKVTGRQEQKNINVGLTERWISMAAGASLAIYGLTRESMSSKATLSILGGYLFYRGQTGYDPLYEAFGISTSRVLRKVKIEKTITINRRPEKVYRFWHNFENLPRFMEHVQSVKVYDDRRSHWAAMAGGVSFEWDAEMIEDIPNERISWRSLANAEVENEGTVEFRRVPGDVTRLLFKASYALPGIEGRVAAQMFRYISEKQLEKELNQFKNLIESREYAGSRF